MKTDYTPEECRRLKLYRRGPGAYSIYDVSYSPPMLVTYLEGCDTDTAEDIVRLLEANMFTLAEKVSKGT